MTRSDPGAIVLGWLTRLTVVLGLLGVLAFDVISLVVTEFGVTDDAAAAARAAAGAYARTSDVDRAYEAALDAARAADANDTIAAGSFLVDQKGTVTLTVEREAVTIVARYIPGIRDQLVMRADGQAAQG